MLVLKVKTDIKYSSVYDLIIQPFTHTEIQTNSNISMVEFQNISKTIKNKNFVQWIIKLPHIKMKTKLYLLQIHA